MRGHGRANDWFFPAESDRWLSVLRIGLGVVVVSYAWPLRSDWNDLYAGTGRGLVSRELFEGLVIAQSPLIPRLGWLVWICQQLGLTESFALSLAWFALLGAGVCLIVGLFSRSTAIVAWFLQLAAAKTGGLFSYGADNFITIGLFYLMMAPLPDRWSWDWVRDRSRLPEPQRLGFHRRVLQIHLCLIYFFSGVTKFLGAGWWNGENLWRALTSPTFDQLPIAVVAWFIPLLPALGLLICFLETTYAFLIWPSWSRRAVLVGACTMHLAIALLMGMYLFGVIMLVLNVAAFGAGGRRRQPAIEAPEATGLQIARQRARP